MTGTIPSEIGNIKTLQQLALPGCNLSGSIPSELGSLSDTLQKITLNSNQLRGQLPSELGNLSQLSKCDFVLKSELCPNLHFLIQRFYPLAW